MKRALLGENALLLYSLLIAMALLLVKVEDFPIYFATDEALQAVKAEELLHNGLRDERGYGFPMTIRGTQTAHLGLAVHLNMPGVLLFGKQIWVVRATTVMVFLVGAAYVALTLKHIYQVAFVAYAVLYFASIPIAFLHARTGYETAIATALFAAFLYHYLRYRTGSPRHIIPAAVFLMLSIYTYAGIWPSLAALAFLLGVLDLPYHWRQRRYAAMGALLCLLMALPLVHYYAANRALLEENLSAHGSVSSTDEPVSARLAAAVQNYGQAVNPRVLFTYAPDYFPAYYQRDYLAGYGYFATWSLPFVLLGLVGALWRIRQAPYWVLLAALLTAPLGGTLVPPHPTRILNLIVPMTLLFGLGIDLMFVYLKKKGRPSMVQAARYLLFVALIAQFAALTYDSLVNGPTWFRDYTTRNGMTWGAKQVFEVVRELAPAYDEINVVPNFAFHSQIYSEFFLDPDLASKVSYYDVAEFGAIGAWPSSTAVICPREECPALLSDPHYPHVSVARIIPAPDGSPGFLVLTRDDAISP